jgi:hypothetical protein
MEIFSSLYSDLFLLFNRYLHIRCSYYNKKERTHRNKKKKVDKNYLYVQHFQLVHQLFILAQDEDSGHHILQDPAGKMRKSHRIPWETTGNSSEMEAVFRPEVFRIFFRWIPVNFRYFPAGTGRKSSEKIRQFSGGNTASTFQRFPVLSCRNRPVIFDLGVHP